MNVRLWWRTGWCFEAPHGIETPIEHHPFSLLFLQFVKKDLSLWEVLGLGFDGANLGLDSQSKLPDKRVDGRVDKEMDRKVDKGIDRRVYERWESR